jgi:hypothetical protein
MKPLAEDTDPKAERVLLDLWRKATPQRKLAMVLDANRTARALAMAGLRQRFPKEDANRLRRRLADLWLGRELAEKAYGLPPRE